MPQQNLANTFWIAKDLSLANEVFEVLVAANYRASGRLWISPDSFIDYWVPDSFLVGEDSSFQSVESKDAGFALIKPKAVKIESTMPNWPTILADAIKQGVPFFETTSPDIKELAESAAARMGKTIRVDLV